MKVIAIDTETFWSKEILMNKAFIATSTDAMLQSRLYDLRNNEQDLKDLKDICEDKDTIKIFHNAPYDIACLWHWNIRVAGPLEDTMVMAAIVNENFSSKRLKDLAREYLKEECNEEKELKKYIAKHKRLHGSNAPAYEFSYDEIPPELLYPYAAKDSEYTIKLYYYFKKALEPFRVLYDMEMELIPVVVEMILNGISIDRDFLADRIIKFGTERNEERAKASEEVKKLGVEFKQKYGTKDKPRYREVEFNPRSTHHLRAIWEKLGLPVLEKTEKGAVSTSSKVLKEFIENEQNYEQFNIESIKHIARYRFLDKQLGTYAIPLYLHYTDEGENKNRAHFTLWQSGAKTGRFSAELIQTMPRIDHDKGIEDVRMIRFAFVPKPEHVLAFIDYEQIEFRLYAHFSNSELLIQNIADGFDIHLGTVYNIFDKEIIDSNPIVRDTFRSMVKAINFGVLYGLGKTGLMFKIKDMIYRAQHVNPELREIFDPILKNIDGIYRTYQEKYKTNLYTQKLVGEIYRKGFIEVNFDSELLKYYRVYRTPKQLAYKSVSMLIQGTAAYIMKFALIRVHKFLKENYPEVKLLLTIHDELVFEIPKYLRVLDIMLKLQNIMEDTTTFKIPITASIKATEKNWAEAASLAIDGKCKKHGQLGIPDKWNIVKCEQCKKKYYVLSANAAY